MENKRFQVKQNNTGLALVDTQSKMTITCDNGEKYEQDFAITYSKDQKHLQRLADFCNFHGRNVAAAMPKNWGQ